MLPLVLVIGWLFARQAVTSAAARIPIPVFALVFFVGLCAINSITALFPAAASVFARIKAPLIEASTWGLLIATAALGLGTSLTAIAALGWGHVATVVGTTLVILMVVTGLMLAAMNASGRGGKHAACTRCCTAPLKIHPLAGPLRSLNRPECGQGARCSPAACVP